MSSGIKVTAQFAALDYVILGGMLAVSAGIGVFYAVTGGRQKTSKEFLLANKNMNPIPVSMSLVASFVSAITVLGTPAEVYIHGTMFWNFCFSYLLVWILVARIFIPVFYEHEITSTNEYLEMRFNRYVRYLGTLCFFLQMFLYLGVVIYAPALALNAVTGLDVWVSVLSIGLVCTFYTTIGGLKAVLWTDVFQFCVMMSGFFAVIFKGSMELGGLGKAWEIADNGSRIELWEFDPDPTIRHSFWTLTIGGAFTWTASFGANQAQIQRYLSCGKKSTALWALGLGTFGMIFVVSTACLTGVVMYAYYAKCDPISMGFVSSADQLMPYIVMELFGNVPGLPGLFLSCVFSAALSTVSSGLNSLSAQAGEDIVKGLFPKISETRYTLVTKIIACAFGGVAILTTFVASRLGALIQASLSVYGMVGGPLLGIFSLGILFPCVNSWGAGVGVIVGLMSSFWLGIGGLLYPPYTPTPELIVIGCNETYVPLNSTSVDDSSEYPTIANFYAISYAWYAGWSWCVTIVIGLLVSFATGHNDPKKADATLIRPISEALCCCLSKQSRQLCNCGVPINENDSDIQSKDVEITDIKVSYINQCDDISDIAT